MIFILGLGMIAAAWLWAEFQQPSSPVLPIETPERVEKLFMLIATEAIEPGTPLEPRNSGWTPITDQALPSNAITRRGGEDLTNPYAGQILLQAAAKGDPLTPDLFAVKDTTNYVARLLSPGKRAFAIAIDSKGTATAGNFILPNDHVDVIRSFNSALGLQSETILTNIRILAIGQSVHGDGLSSSGETATVEVDLHEAEILATAQRSGQISLALRNPADEKISEQRPINLIILKPAAITEKAP